MGQKLLAMALVMAAFLPRPALAEGGAMCQAVRHDVQAYLATGASCPCPYSTTHDGHACGKRSAWAKMGAAAPRCYADETAARMATPAMTRRPELACGDEEIARPAPVQAGGVMTAGLVGYGLAVSGARSASGPQD